MRRSRIAGVDAERLRAGAQSLCAERETRWAGANAARTAALLEAYASDVALAAVGREA